MATEKQIAANRRNATRSTGPRTAAGKAKSSRNAFRHGLSLAQEIDPSTAAEIELLAQAIAGDDASEEKMSAACQAAAAQLELRRIQRLRHSVDATANSYEAKLEDLRRLAALDRYERYARTRRRRATLKVKGNAPTRASLLAEQPRDRVS
jgi:hypothetical protein